MDFIEIATARAEPLPHLFEATFSASEGAEEGRLIGGLVGRLLNETPSGDLRIFAAMDHDDMAGAILFTRMRYASGEREVWLLAPVAVAPHRQGQGIGQSLIRAGLAQMTEAGAEIAVTYGDPAFYGRVGFRPILEDDLPAPFLLSMPEGWLGQSLTPKPLGKLRGPVAVAPGFDDPAFW